MGDTAEQNKRTKASKTEHHTRDEGPQTAGKKDHKGNQLNITLKINQKPNRLHVLEHIALKQEFISTQISQNFMNSCLSASVSPPAAQEEQCVLRHERRQRNRLT